MEEKFQEAIKHSQHSQNLPTAVFRIIIQNCAHKRLIRIRSN